jgi:hypothetical protein
MAGRLGLVFFAVEAKALWLPQASLEGSWMMPVAEAERQKGLPSRVVEKWKGPQQQWAKVQESPLDLCYSVQKQL